jgi:heme/copper-type cytochrome/quinol oxidase subunit 2
MVEVQLAEDLGYGTSWLLTILVFAIVVSTGFFIYTILSTRYNHTIVRGRDSLKYKLYKYHAERYWAIFVAAILIWFWFLGLPWTPPIAFSNVVQSSEKVHVIGITAGQWFWKLEDLGFENGNNSSNTGTTSFVGERNASTEPVKIKVGETVKFIAHSLDVNHGFGILRSSKSMDSPLIQMQVVPGYDNIFYYTFKKAGTYTIRCLEYCGWNHPYMISQITVYAS